MSMENLLEIRNLKINVKTEDGFFDVSNISFLKIKKGEVLGIVGESGCGKSVMSLSIMGLIQDPLKVNSGEIFFEGQDLLKKSDEELIKIRGKDIAIIFQEPMSSLNPVMKCGDQVMEAIRVHQTQLTYREAKEKTIESFKKVGITDPERRFYEYPHQFSGGMQQRIMIAMALCNHPKLLIADEPTTALDVTIQAQVLELMRGLQKEIQTSMLLITHDLGVIAEMCDRVMVMYAGEIVEEGSVEDIFYRTKHPYTKGLLNSLPQLNLSLGERKPLIPIPGQVPTFKDLSQGCHFNNRCTFAGDFCKTNKPQLKGSETHRFACHYPIGHED